MLLPQGAQRPRICHVPDYVSSSGPEAVALARLAGLEPDDWQEFVVTNALGERPDGKWAAQTVGLTVARQNGKGSILEIVELFALFVLGLRFINHTAHQQKTATNHFRRLLELIEGVPEFEQRVLNAPKGKGNEAIFLRGGQAIFFATRAGGGGRGLTFDLQVYDEAMYLTEQDRSSLAPTMSALSMHGNIQTWYVGSAVDEQDSAQDGIPFAQVRQSGLSGSRGVAYFEWSAPGDDPDQVSEADAADPALWAMANPGLGIRISPEWIDHERTTEMGPRGFAVERLGIGAWPDPSTQRQRKISAADWTACADLDSEAHGAVCLTLDVSEDRESASIGTAGWRDDGLAHVEIVPWRRPPDTGDVAVGLPPRGTGWVVDRVVEVTRSHDVFAVLVAAKSPAASLVPALTSRGVTVILVSASEQAEACGELVDAVAQATIKHLGTGDLLRALKGAAVKTLGDAWAWARRPSSIDISPLVAVTLAHWGLKTIEPPEEGGPPLLAFV